MKRELMEGLVEAAVIIGTVDKPEIIPIINDAMDEIRNLEAKIRTQKQVIDELKRKIMRQRVKVYNGQGGRIEED